jgi:eukaryotic-like serine/threonine-protein kinase
MTDETSKRIGDYQILDELGSGGMGRVWRVRNVISDRIEAMKVLLPDLAGRQELAARFLREIKLMASLNHPNIAQLRTAFTADNQLYMVMEYVEGKTMAQKLERGPIPVPDALNYIGQVLGAVSYAHQQHVIHRDIKPANMMLTPQGVIKLMDFGIARAGEDRSLTMTGTTMGSLSYMSPEQVKGEPTDARSDLYSVGVSLYEFVTGRQPFVATSDYSIMAAHVREAPKPPIELHPGLPSTLNDIILMAIAKDPAQRFQTADAFRNALSCVPVTLPATPAITTGVLGATTVNTLTPAPANLQTAPVANPSGPVSAPVAAPQEAKMPYTTPVPAPPPPQPSGHRGLYMTLGALIVLAVLVVAGIYMPRSFKTHAKSPESAPATADTQSPAPQSPDLASQSAPQANTATPPAAPPTPSLVSTDSTPAPSATSAPVGNSNSLVQPTPPPPAVHEMNSVQGSSPAGKPPLRAKKFAGQNAPQNNGAMGDAGGSMQNDSGAPAQAGAANTAQLDELEHEVDQLSNRAAAVNSSLDRLQQEQGASGYGLRGDMVERQASMKANLFKAEEAMQHGDAARTKKYADMVNRDLEVLERFLGH